MAMQPGKDDRPYSNEVARLLGAAATPAWCRMADRVADLKRQHLANFPAISGVFALPTRRRAGHRYSFAHVNRAYRLVTASVHCRSKSREAIDVTVFGRCSVCILSAVRAAVRAGVLHRGRYLVHYAVRDGQDGAAGEALLMGWTWVTRGREPNFCPYYGWDDDDTPPAVPGVDWCDGALDDDFLAWLTPADFDRTFIVLTHVLTRLHTVWTLGEMDEDGDVRLVDFDALDGAPVNK